MFQATLQWQYQHPNQRMAGEWNYSTRGHVMGWRALYRLPSLHWDMGGEVYYTHTEHSGGCMRNEALVWSMLNDEVSPISRFLHAC